MVYISVMLKSYIEQKHISFASEQFKVAWLDFWVTIPFNFERLEQHHYQSNRKSNVSGMLEKDEIFKWSTFH